MLRRLLIGVCGVLLKIFFRRIEVVGRERLPKDGSVVFALNHPSGLIDPLFILCLSGKRVSFLAKAPLFRMPFVGVFVRAFECLPVERARDGGDPGKNRQMMLTAAELLSRGNALALFPEGTSHSDPTLKRFRSGAARIALAARALSEKPVHLVPCALYYESKQTFRSRAVLTLGEAICVPLVELDASGESPLEAGQELTRTIAERVLGILPTADTVQGLVLAEQAERVINAALRDSKDACPKAAKLVTRAALTEEALRRRPTLAERMASRKRLIDGYLDLIEQKPEEVRAVIERIGKLGDELELAGLPIDARSTGGNLFRRKVFRSWALGVCLAPLGIFSLLVHAPAYLLVKKLSFRVAGDSTDVLATVKVIGGLLFFPLTWLLAAGALALTFDEPLWLFSVLLGPVLGSVAIVFQTQLSALQRTLTLKRRVTQAAPDWSQVERERAKLAEEIASLLGQT